MQNQEYAVAEHNFYVYCKVTLVYVWKNYVNLSKRAYREIYAILIYAF